MESMLLGLQETPRVHSGTRNRVMRGGTEQQNPHQGLFWTAEDHLTRPKTQGLGSSP